MQKFDINNLNEIKKENIELESITISAIEKLESDINDYAIELLTYVPETSLLNDIKKIL